MKIAFAPIIENDAEILILGTMPSEESLRKQQYYGHKTNQFWRIIFALFNETFSDIYAERVNLLKRNKIALWDVLACCEGQGSADSDIKNEQPNNFEAFYKKYPNIRMVFFSSKKAAEYYKKYVGFSDNKIFDVLPSPSSANARMPLEQKVKEWRKLLIQK